jgi:tetratricopeptide (TPR) repeat protein/predicted Ser/Thr protein kinase
MDETVAAHDVTIRRRERTLERGDALGRYVVLERLGAGGMGVVYAAYDPELDRKVAVKLVRVQASAETQASGGGSRLLREAQAMARLAHPNVITVHDVGRIEDEVFLAMEFVDGQSLSNWLEDRRDWPQILSTFMAAGAGLAAAHAAGVIHRDFKPDNVLVGNDGRVRVLDFGLARRDELDESPTHDLEESVNTSDLTRTGAVMGTPAYMSPEQHMGAPTDPKTDQFSFCVALYEALYGERPFGGRTPTELAVNVVEGNLRDAPRDSTVPTWIRRCLARGLSVDPDARFASMTALLRALSHDPTRRYRRWARRILLAAPVAAALGYFAFDSDSAPTMCTGAERRLDGIWDDQVRGRVQHSFEATDKAFAKASFERVAKTLDAYATTWTDTHVEACESTRVFGTQSDSVLDLRMACLDRRLDALEAVARVLSSADESVVQNAAKMVVSLPRLDECSDLEWLRATVRPPEDEQTRLRVDELRAKHLAVRAQHQAGHVDQALDMANDTLAQARDLDYPPVLAESLLSLGNAQEGSRDLAKTRETLREAMEAAAASQHRRVYAEALVLLVRVEGYRSANYELAEWLARLAEAELHALDDDPKLTASLFSNRGTLRYTQVRYDEAIADYERALDIQRRELGGDDLRIADLEYNIGAVLHSMGQHREAEAKFRAALDAWVAAVGPDHPEIGYCYNNLSIALLNLGDLEGALDNAKKAQKVWEAAYGREHPDTARSMNNIGEALIEAGKTKEALVWFEEALAVKRRTLGPDHPDTWGTAANVAYAREVDGRIDEAAALFAEAADAMTRIAGPGHPAAVTARLGLVNIDLQRGNAEAAIAAVENILVDIRSGPGEAHPMYIEALWTLSDAQQLGGRTEAALASLREARSRVDADQDPHRAAEIEKRMTQLGGASPD